MRRPTASMKEESCWEHPLTAAMAARTGAVRFLEPGKATAAQRAALQALCRSVGGRMQGGVCQARSDAASGWAERSGAPEREGGGEAVAVAGGQGASNPPLDLS